MPLCPNCGRDNPPDFRFCGFCAEPLGPPGGAEQRKTVSVLFTDLVGFTSLSERLDPEAVRAIQGRYLAAMKAVAERHGGTVEKFIGDAVMAIFGVPTTHEDDALRAVRAAVEMREELERLSAEMRAASGIELAAHTGVNTGEVVVEEGSSERLATGDPINVAARLQQAAGPGEILIGPETFRLVRAAVQAEPVEGLTLKGKAEPITAHRVVDVDPAAPGYLRRPDAPLVGRDEELQAVLSAFERAETERRCRLVTLLGPPGMGKSRLSAEVASRVEPKWQVLEGRCLPYGEGITFWPVADALKEAAGVRDGDSSDEAIRRIQALVTGEGASEVGARVAAAIGIGEAGRASLQETFWAIRRTFESLAEDRPVAWLVEDIHWAEPALLDLIEYLVEFTTDRPMVILCTARPEVRETRPDWGRLGDLIPLTPLTGEQSARLVRDLLGPAGFPEAVLELVSTTAEGNPLFLEELLRKLIDEEVIVRTNGHWETRGSIDRVAAPATISAVLAARIDGLADGERATIQRSSVVGRIFYWGAIEALSPEPERPDVGGHLRTLLRKELIHPFQSAFAGEDAFAFGHILVRDAAYDSTPKAVRADLHERFARWLEGAAGDRIPEYEEIVGYHLEQAVRSRSSLGVQGPREDALAREAGARLASAGQRAQARGDHAASVSLLERAVALLPSDAAERRTALVTLGLVLMEGGRLTDGVAALDEAISLAQEAGDVRVELSAIARRTYVRVHSQVIDDLGPGWDEAERAVETLEEIGATEELAEALAFIGTGRFFRGDVPGGIQYEERARELAIQVGDGPTANFAERWLSAMMMRGPTPVDVALRRVESFVREAPPDGYFEASMTRQLGTLQLLAGREEEARASLERALALANRLRLWIEIAGCHRHLGELEMMLGRYEEAEPHLREGVEITQRIGDPAHGTSIASMLGSVLARLGRVEEAEGSLDLAKEWLSVGDVDGEFEYWRARAAVAEATGRPDEAVEHAAAALRSVEGTGYVSMEGEGQLGLAQALIQAGDLGRARAAVGVALEIARARGDVPLIRSAEALLGELGG